jgi:hypothetical protein
MTFRSWLLRRNSLPEADRLVSDLLTTLAQAGQVAVVERGGKKVYVNNFHHRGL